MRLVKRETQDQAARHVQRRAEARQSARAISFPPGPDPRKLARLENNPSRWLRTLFPLVFRRPFGRVHREIITGARHAMETKGRFGVAAPRGTGKSLLLDGMAFWGLLTRRIQFAVVVPWAAKDVLQALSFWLLALSDNDTLAAWYPLQTAPFRASHGSAQKIKTLVWATDPNGRVPAGQPTGARVTLSQGLIVLPGSLGVIGSATLNGNIRGLRHPLPDGSVLRPDCILIDDPSDPTTARSDILTRHNCEFINADVLGTGGPDVKVAAMMAATILSRADTASHYLMGGEPDWQAVVVPQIEAWPDDMGLWDEWNAKRLEGLAAKDGGRSAREFYRRHRPAMRKGFAVSWRHRYDPRLEPDAYWAAMADYYSMGRRAFMSERQNAPESETDSVYTITVEQAQGRVNGLEPNAAQADGLYTTIGIDVNTYALTWCAASITNDMAAAVTAYGVHPGAGSVLWSEESGIDLQTAIHSQLVALARQLETRFPHIDRLAIDGNYQTDTIYRAVEQLRGSMHCDVIAARGISSQKFGEPRLARAIKRRGEQCHTIKGPRGLSLVFNSHHWHKALQTGFLAQPLAAGSVSLFGKPGDTHRMFAEHICRDILEEIDTHDGREVHKWRQGPGRNDLADAAVMALVGAAIEGASANAERTKPEPPKPAGTWKRLAPRRW